MEIDKLTYTSGDGYDYGHGNGSGAGYGDGDGDGDGYGYGYGYGSGAGYGYGDGYGNGDGDGIYGGGYVVGTVAGYDIEIFADDIVKVGCLVHTHQWWLHHWRAVARSNGIALSDQTQAVTHVLQKLCGDAIEKWPNWDG